MVDEFPIDEISAMVDGNPGEILEGGGDEVVCVFVADDRRIRVEPWKDGIIVCAQRHFG